MLGRPLLVAQLDAMHSGRGGDWFYRTFAPGRALAELPDVYVVSLDQAHRELQRVLEGADVLVINGVCSADLLPVIAERKRRRRLTVFEINDDVQAMQAAHPLVEFFSQPENLRLYRRLALSSDAVQYSSEELQRVYASLNPRGRVFHNHLGAPPPLRARTGRSLKVGWAGSAGHFEDLAAVAPVLIDFIRASENVTLCLMCSERIWRLFDALPGDRKQHRPVGTIDDYYDFVSELDIGLAPNQDTGFNRARSDVKFLEYAAHGAVPVVQRLTPYLNSVRDGNTGFFFGSSDELGSLLTRLLRDPAERQRVRESAHRYVATERLQSAHAGERLAFYCELLAPSVDGHAAPLFAELASLEGAETSGRHCVLTHGRFETLLHDGLLLLQQSHSQQQGAALLREAARLAPQHPLPELFLGIALHDESELRAALQKNPRSVQALLALGSSHLAQGQFRPALERFLAAAEVAPGYEMPFAHAAQAMQKLGAAKEAAEFERLAQNMAQALAPAARPVGAVASGSRDRPAWHLLEQGVHLETLDPSYAPTGLLELVEPAPQRVLDLGCFCGGTGRWLKQRFPVCEVVGIEMLEKAAAMAAQVYDRVLVGTLEQIDFERAGLTPGSFDAIIAADVLEHLFNPWQALKRVRPLLSAQGALYVSLPNVRNLKLLSELARGRFEYAGAGILDITHVRFFTRQSAVRMLEETGFAVQDIRINPDQRLAPVFEGKNLDQTSSIELDGLALSNLSREDLLELAALQLYLRCVPS